MKHFWLCLLLVLSLLPSTGQGQTETERKQFWAEFKRLGEQPLFQCRTDEAIFVLSSSQNRRDQSSTQQRWAGTSFFFDSSTGALRWLNDPDNHSSTRDVETFKLVYVPGQAHLLSPEWKAMKQLILPSGPHTGMVDFLHITYSFEPRGLRFSFLTRVAVLLRGTCLAQ